MPRTVIGLDVGTAAVRAAEVRLGRGRPTLVRFAQVALEPGAVIAGEVVDAAAVGAALKRLWRDGGFKSRHVVTGVAGPRVVARTTELPGMADDELRSSLRFQVQELIPIPLDEAVIDHQIVERTIDPEGNERVGVLVVAAHRDLLRSLMAALEAGGLVADRIDLIPFALIRSLHESGFPELDGGGSSAAEAIVDIGSGITNVVVHERGVPRFVRSLPVGGSELTDALVTDLGVDFGEAESLKRGGEPGDLRVRDARAVVEMAAIPLLEEIRTSLDFWQTQPGSTELRTIRVIGGSTRLADLDARLERLTGLHVERGRAFARFDTSKSGLAVDELLLTDSVGAVAAGLALSGESLPAGGRRISLLPADIAEHRRERRQVFVAGAAVAAFALVLLALYLTRSGQVSHREDEATSTETRTTELETEISQLADVEALQSDISTRSQTVQAVLAGDVAWTRLVQEVAAVLPNDVWLTELSATRATATAPGQVNVSGMGFDQTSTARWILRVSELESLRGVWVPSSTKSETEGGQSIVTFGSNAELTPAAESHRAQHFGEVGR